MLKGEAMKLNVFLNICVTLTLTFFTHVNAQDWQSLGHQITLEETQDFPGNWSLCPEEIYLALKYCEYDESLKILEFGAGEGTVQLAKLLTNKNIPFEYYSFESSRNFIKQIENVFYYLYALPPLPYNDLREAVKQVEIPELPTFDLVIVDGPHGVSRCEWYAKFKKYTRPGTVLLIDDFSLQRVWRSFRSKFYIHNNYRIQSKPNLENN